METRPAMQAINSSSSQTGRSSGRPVSQCLLGHNIFSLRTFLPLRHFHRNGLTLFESLETFHLDRAVMNKNILPTFAFDKAKSLIIVEPLNGS